MASPSPHAGIEGFDQTKIQSSTPMEAAIAPRTTHSFLPIGGDPFGFGSSSLFQGVSTFQSYGLDRNSRILSSSDNLLLNSSYQPQAGSPAINSGKQLSYYNDITGNTFSTRLTIGAYEYVVQGNNVLIYVANQGAVVGNTSGQQTVNDVHSTRPQTSKDSVLREVMMFKDPYIISLIEHLDYLRAKKQLIIHHNLDGMYRYKLMRLKDVHYQKCDMLCRSLRCFSS